jgi:hypothetical protein
MVLGGDERRTKPSRANMGNLLLATTIDEAVGGLSGR